MQIFRRGPKIDSEFKVSPFRRLRNWTIAPLQKVARAFFRFHTPAWVARLGSSVKPPRSNLSFAQYFNPFFWLVWMARFSFDWILSRPYRSMGPAIPAICGCALLCVAYFELRFRSVSHRQSAYRAVLDSSLKRGDDATALVAVGTLTDIDPFDLNLRYQRAVLEAKRGNKELAREQMMRLVESKRFSDAALWLIQNDLDLQNMGEWTELQHQQFNKWTDIALQSGNESSQHAGKTLMASYLLARGSYAESLRYFAMIVPRNPEFAYTAATICKQQGDLRGVTTYATQASVFYNTKLQQSPSDRANRINLAKCLILLNREVEASELLVSGYDLSRQQDQELRTAAAEALTVYERRLAEQLTSPETLMKRLQVLQSALQIAPDNSRVIDAVIGVLFECRKDRNQEVLTLKTAIVKGIDPQSAHFIRGTVALLDNNMAEARIHLELAAKSNKQLPGVLNNLAVALSNLGKAEWEHALALSNAALESMPDHPYFRDTRGQILVKLGRFQDAISDLEVALKAPELAKDVHGALASAYDGLGLTDLADSHRQLASGTVN